MTPELFAIGGGVVLLILAALGGGIEAKEIKVPQISPISRALCATAGVALIAIGIFLRMIPTPPAILASNSTSTPASSMAVNTPSAPAHKPSESPSPPNANQPPMVGPSFDCTKATHRSEKIVCSSPELAVLDLAMSNAYRDALARAPQSKAALRDAQNHWLRETRELCADATCLKSLYKLRISELNSYHR